MKPEQRPFAFLIPNTEAFVSGGNLYNRRLIDALRSNGHTVYESEQLRDLPSGALLLVDTLLAAGLPKAKAAKAGLIVHHLQSLYPPKGWSAESWFQKRERHWLQHFSWYLATSPFTADYLQSRGVLPTAVVVEPGLAKLPGVTAKAPRPISALLVANLVRRKGVLPLLQAWERRPPPGVELRILGSRDREPRYAEACLAKAAGLPGVRYLGVLPQEAAFAQYAKANLLVSAAYMETYGMALQEAAAAGLPILAFEGGNAPYHVQSGKNGELCATQEEILSWLFRWAEQPPAFQPYLERARQLAPRRQRSWADAAAEFESIKIER